MMTRLARLRRLCWRIAQLVLLMLFLVIVIPLIGVGFNCVSFSAPTSQQPSAPADVQKIKDGLKGYARSEDQTYLTLPEWYIVYSADEYAAFIAEHPPSQFPYFQAIGQNWSSYYGVCAITRHRYPFNGGYHLSNVITGASFTLEYLIKGLYENTLGRLTEWLSSSELTEEDAYARKVAKEFGAFIHAIPWYEFPYREKLVGLWRETKGWGANPVRKWERKLALSMEYGVKAVYAWLIKLGGQAVYAPEDLEIHAWVENLSEEVLKREPRVKVAQAINAQAAFVSIPRYEEFTQTAPRLMRQGVRFVEIAGNDDILITLIAPRSWQYKLRDGAFLFVMPILTQPHQNRVVVSVPVKALPTVLAELEQQGIQLEHLYDY
jgi:hypothetical protein